MADSGPRTPPPLRRSVDPVPVVYPPMPNPSSPQEFIELKARVHALCMEARVISGTYIKDPSYDR